MLAAAMVSKGTDSNTAYRFLNPADLTQGVFTCRWAKRRSVAKGEGRMRSVDPE